MLVDSDNTTDKVSRVLEHYKERINVYEKPFTNFKERVALQLEKATGEYIFGIDADEMPHPNLIRVLPEIILVNPKNEVFLVPRVNTVDGLTEEHVEKWGWRTNKKGWTNVRARVKSRLRTER